MNLLKLIILALYFTSHLNGEQIQALVIGDTLSDLDSSIPKDVDWMERGIHELGEQLHLKTTIHHLSGNHVTREKIFQTIDQIDTDEEDTLIFYFSGHGFRTRTKKSAWPFLKTETDGSAIDLDQIIERLQNKKGRFRLILADVCNIDLSQADAVPRKGKIQVPEIKSSVSCIRDLFQKTRGTLVMTSAMPGEFSWSTKKGGLFTQAFYGSLAELCQTGDRSWSHVIASIKKKTRKHQHLQTAWMS